MSKTSDNPLIKKLLHSKCTGLPTLGTSFSQYTDFILLDAHQNPIPFLSSTLFSTGREEPIKMSQDLIPSILSTKIHHLDFNNHSLKTPFQRAWHHGVCKHTVRCQSSETTTTAGQPKKQRNGGSGRQCFLTDKTVCCFLSNVLNYTNKAEWLNVAN